MNATAETLTTAEPLFREVQRFRQPWLWIGLLGSCAASLLPLGVALFWRARGENKRRDHLAGGDGSVARAVASAAIPMSIAGLLAAIKLAVEVHPGRLYVRFRGLLVNREIPLADIERADAVTYWPLRDYGGWGLRHGAKGNAYNVRGNRGVRLTFVDGRELLIGSQRPEALAAAITQARRR